MKPSPLVRETLGSRLRPSLAPSERTKDKRASGRSAGARAECEWRESVLLSNIHEWLCIPARVLRLWVIGNYTCGSGCTRVETMGIRTRKAKNPEPFWAAST